MRALLALILLSSIPAHAAESFQVKGEQFEGCQCDTYCPCVFSKDATFGECRALVVWKITEGTCGKTDLAGTSAVIAVTKIGKNVDKEIGHFEGTVYISEKASEDQRKALTEVYKGVFGPAFAKLDFKTADIDIDGEAGNYDMTMGKLAHLKMEPLRGVNGEITTVSNPPSPIALPTFHYAKATTHTFDDGSNKWDFANRNAFYGNFEHSSDTDKKKDKGKNKDKDKDKDK
jgi:hypothetical protein